MRAGLTQRLVEYSRATRLPRISVVFHGGEPLLAGAETLAAMCAEIRDAMPDATAVDFSMQTNGVLLDDQAIDILEQADVGISLSIDGPRHAHDRHRLTVGGRSTFDAVLGALQRLKRRPATFAGVISVIDPAVGPRELFEFFDEHRPPRVDFLLPDANHLRPPPGRESDPTLYERWLLQAFDLWFDEFSHLRARTFEAILDGLVGLPSRTDAFGFGDVSLLVIETDGSYHDLDVLKVTASGATALGTSVANASVRDAISSPRLEAHRRLLQREGLSSTCRSCPEVEICGGGSVPHRYGSNGFDHPTVYCQEMLTLIRHARRRVVTRLESEQPSAPVKRDDQPSIALHDFDVAEHAAGLLEDLVDEWTEEASSRFSEAIGLSSAGFPNEAAHLLSLTVSDFGTLAIQPTVVAWSEVVSQHANGRTVRALSGKALGPDPGYLQVLSHEARELIDDGLRLHRPDPWLLRPFEDERLVAEAEEVVTRARGLAEEALAVIGSWRPAVLREMHRLTREVVFIRDLTADPDKCVSFSDDSIPGALYSSVRRASGLIDPVDLADSLIHEHRHQKLYLLSRRFQLVVSDRPLIASPWRNDPRPPSGLLHAVFVFVELLGFWRHVAATQSETRDRADAEITLIATRLAQGFATLETVALTPAGRDLVDRLRGRVHSA